MKQLLLLTAFIALTATASPVENFGSNLANLNNAFAHRSLHILQIGDSHTAGDYFTEQLRKRLQAEIGDGGIGFAPAGRIHNQRTARHDYVNGDWSFVNSRSSSGDFVLGGIMATGGYGSPLTVTSQYYANDTQFAKILVKGSAGQTVTVQDGLGSRNFTLTHNGWQAINTQVKFPTRVFGDVSVGGFWLNKGAGGVVSAMGINGAMQSVWNNWRSGIGQDLATSGANLVILAYGTNEAFSPNYNPSAHKSAINQAIAKIRQGLPNATILLINAPESLKSTGGSCGTRGTYLDSVRSVIREVAQQNRTLYWDWQGAMGGACSMKSWINQGLATRDGVHFTRAGYERSANDLYNNLRAVMGQGTQSYAQNSYQQPTYQQPIYQQPIYQQPSQNYATPNQPYIQQQPTYTAPKVTSCTINGQPCSKIR